MQGDHSLSQRIFHDLSMTKQIKIMTYLPTYLSKYKRGGANYRVLGHIVSSPQWDRGQSPIRKHIFSIF